MGRVGATEESTSDDGTGDAGSHHRRRTIHLSLHSNQNSSKCVFNMKAKNLSLKNKVLLLLLFRPGQAKFSRLQYLVGKLCVPRATDPVSSMKPSTVLQVL